MIGWNYFVFIQELLFRILRITYSPIILENKNHKEQI